MRGKKKEKRKEMEGKKKKTFTRLLRFSSRTRTRHVQIVVLWKAKHGKNKCALWFLVEKYSPPGIEKYPTTVVEAGYASHTPSKVQVTFQASSEVRCFNLAGFCRSLPTVTSAVSLFVFPRNNQLCLLANIQPVSTPAQRSLSASRSKYLSWVPLDLFLCFAFPATTTVHLV